MKKKRTIEQQIIWLYYFDGYTEEEISKLLGISQQRVNQKKREALTKLKEDIE